MKLNTKTFFGPVALAAFFVITLVFSGCSKDAEDAANSASQSPGNINGSWKATTGLIIKISGVSSSAMGKAVVTAVGTSLPAAALGGECMSEIEYIRGGYWEAYNNTYFPGTGWKRNNVVGLAMNDSGTEFKIGTAVYVKQ
jgi:hypothetical protein